MEVKGAAKSKSGRRWLRLLLGALIGAGMGVGLAFCTRYLPDTSFSSGSQVGGDDYFVVKLWGTILLEESHPRGTLYYVPELSGGAFGPTPRLREWSVMSFRPWGAAAAGLGPSGDDLGQPEK